MKVRPTYANVASTLALAVALGGGAVALASDPGVIDACVTKPGLTNAGAIRIVSDPTTCTVNQNPLSWNQVGPQGPQGPEGPQGPAGSPDTPQQVLNKIVQVDGDGSGLDASLLDGLNSTAFLRTTGKAVDADKLDGLNSTAFPKRAAGSSGTIGLSSIGANTCKDVVFGIGGLKPGDVVALMAKEDDTFPARLTMMPLNVTADNTLNVRICNGTSTASVADGDIRVRWYAFR